MGARQNGVDGAIALLLALSRHNGRVALSVVMAECGLARASLHRIALTLEAAGLVQRERGWLSLGPAAAAFVPGATARHWTGLEARPVRSIVAERKGQGLYSGPIVLSPPPAKRASGRFRIGFSNASMSNPWRVALVHSVEFAVSRLGSAVHRLTVKHAGDDAVRQARDIDAMVAQGIDGLLVSAAAPEAIVPTLERAMAAGIAVVLVDRGVAAAAPHTSFVNTDDRAIGQVTALWLAERLKGKGRILLLAGEPEAEPAQDRLAAARAAFASFAELELLPVTWTRWLRETGRAAVREHLRAGAVIDGVWCDSGLQGVGSLQAFIESGVPRGKIPPHTGGDLNLAYKLAIRHGVPLAAMDSPPAMGRRAVEVLFAAMLGQWVPSRVDVSSAVVLTKGATTRSVRADIWAEDHVRWDLPDDLVLHSGLGEAYNPRSFRIHYAGNSYNRSAARVGS